MGFELHSELFVEETIELLDKIEVPLMELEENPGRSDLVDEIFRALHTIKGSAGMFGYEEIARFTHDLETTYDSIRNGRLTATPEIIDLTLKAKDHIRELLVRRDSDNGKDGRDMILSRLHELTGEEAEPAAEEEPSDVSAPAAEPGGNEFLYRIRFIPERDILLRGVQIAPLFRELAEMGRITITASTGNIPPVDEFNPDLCYLDWTIDMTTSRSEKEIHAVFMFVEDYATLEIENMGIATGPSVETTGGTVERSAMESPGQQVTEKDTGKNPLFVERRKVDTTSIRVKNEKLDVLVNMVGELVTLHSHLAQESNEFRLPEFMTISEGLGRLTADLRDITMSIRMVPLEETFLSFNRLIHDLSKNLGKKMRLATDGGETELDKNVIEELRDPLMHLVRNAADHGIELPAERLRLGKEETGTIRIMAEHVGASVVIRISDDGSGLNREKILTRAIERGMAITPDADDRTVYSLIFEPGFSTAEITTDISGRGVGMDVVKKNLEKLRGTIDTTTEPGRGTTISLTIPLTLAIIDGFMVEIGGNFYIFNLALVRECVAYNSRENSSDTQGMMRIRGDLVPFIDMRKLFDLPGKPSAYPQVVITEIEGMSIGFLVDKVVGHHQTVIKPLGKGVRDADMFSGASILGSGSIALILDVNHIISRSTVQDDGTMTGM